MKTLAAKHPFNGPLSGTTQVSQYQKDKTNLDFTGARDSERQWYQLGHMQVCTSLQTDNHASTSVLKFFTGRMPFLPPNQQCQSTHNHAYTGQTQSTRKQFHKFSRLLKSHAYFSAGYSNKKISWLNTKTTNPGASKPRTLLFTTEHTMFKNYIYSLTHIHTTTAEQFKHNTTAQ